MSVRRIRSDISRLEGRVFGRLTVLKYLGRTKSSTSWLCLCSCGNQKKASAAGLKADLVQSCGCLAKERKSAYNRSRKIENKYDSPEFSVWHGMISRCLRPNSHGFKTYGRAGINVCDRWLKFENFQKDMAPRPPGMTLDRLDPYDDYKPENCRWATAKEQGAFKRKNIKPHFIDPQIVRRSTEWILFGGGNIDP